MKNGKSDIWFFRLEFSEDQQHFHQNRGTHEPETRGWTTIDEWGEDRKQMLFCDIMEGKYKFSQKKKIKALTIKKEWKVFDKIFTRAIEINDEHEHKLLLLN